MDKETIFKNIDALVLCGGQGTRLRPVISDKPKILAEIRGKPFIEILLDNLASHGFRRIIFGVGHLKEQIIEYFQTRPRNDFLIEFSKEETPLGTGGAIKKAKPLIKSDHFLAMNGDCLFSVDFEKFYQNHLDRKALLSMVLSKTADVSSCCGKVVLAADNKIASFNEKRDLANAGIYFMRKDIFDFMPLDDFFSLEYDFFPKILDYSYGFVSDEEFIDIGTPERYQKANRLFSK